jgi:hypothetical protein
MAATSAAVKACRVRVVGGLAAVAAEEDEAGEVGGEAHVAESAVGEGELVCGGDAGVV